MRAYARVWSGAGAGAGACASALLILGLGPVFLNVHVLVGTLLSAEQTITRLARKPSLELNACYVNFHVTNAHGVVYVSTCFLVVLVFHVDRIMLYVGQSRPRLFRPQLLWGRNAHGLRTRWSGLWTL